MGMQGYTSAYRVYRGIQGSTRVYKAIQRYARVYRAVKWYTGVYKSFQRYARVYKGIQGYAMNGCQTIWMAYHCSIENYWFKSACRGLNDSKKSSVQGVCLKAGTIL